jgi:hypothetical protein
MSFEELANAVEHSVIERTTALAGASNLDWIGAEPLGGGDRIGRHASLNTRLLSEIPGTAASGSDLHPVVIGGCLGAAVGTLFHAWFPGLVPNVGPFTIVGMAGFFAGVAKTTISTL